MKSRTCRKKESTKRRNIVPNKKEGIFPAGRWVKRTGILLDGRTGRDALGGEAGRKECIPGLKRGGTPSHQKRTRIAKLKT